MAAFKLSTILPLYILCFPFIGSTEISSGNSRPSKTFNDSDGLSVCTGKNCTGNHDIIDIKIYIGRKLSGISSPPVTTSTRAILTLNSFEKHGDGGGPSKCDERFHSNNQKIVALSTGWFADGSRCGQVIEIRARNGRTAVAKVVDECDSRRGCKNNIVDAADSVWEALGLDENLGTVPVTWSMA